MSDKQDYCITIIIDGDTQPNAFTTPKVILHQDTPLGVLAIASQAMLDITCQHCSLSRKETVQRIVDGFEQESRLGDVGGRN